jgi:hypothetical protein
MGNTVSSGCGNSQGTSTSCTSSTTLYSDATGDTTLSVLDEATDIMTIPT